MYNLMRGVETPEVHFCISLKTSGYLYGFKAGLVVMQISRGSFEYCANK